MRPAALASVTAALVLGLAACSDGGDSGSEPSSTVTATPQDSSAATEPPSIPPSAETASPTGKPGPPEVIGTIATNLQAPWGIAFLPNGDAVVTERDTTRVLVIDGDSHDVHQVGELDAAVGLGSQGGEAGLLGVAVSPSYDRDHTLFFYLSTADDNRIVKARLNRGSIGPTTVLLDGIPHGFIHDGGRLTFGPDGYLYASTGETGEGELAQDKSTTAGKILRITVDGDPAPGNPFPGSPIWSYGHRNVQGLAFDDAGRLWASEFGASTYDELNLIRAGHNYGWPMVEGTRGDQGGKGFTDPQIVWDTDANSPSGLAFLDGHLWLASLRGERLWRVEVDGAKASHPADFFVGDYGRMRTVVAAPDGNLWVSTSNSDGRGDPKKGDDRILVIRP